MDKPRLDARHTSLAIAQLVRKSGEAFAEFQHKKTPQSYDQWLEVRRDIDRLQKERA